MGNHAVRFVGQPAGWNTDFRRVVFELFCSNRLFQLAIINRELMKLPDCLIDFFAAAFCDVLHDAKLRYEFFRERLNVEASGEKIDPRILGRRIAGFRKSCGKTQEETGKQLGMSRPTYIAIEKGTRRALAIAKTRSWILATDDRKAGRIADELSVPVWTTPELIKRWPDSANPSRDELRETLRRVEERASFFPPASHPLYTWWRNSANA